jgi:tripartite-type tricarboxylate transporter receptor subunit TctC
MEISRRSALALAAIATACAVLAGPALGQDFPTRNIALIVPYPAGGPTDAIGRIIADGAGKELGQSVVVENRPGASGIVGSAAVAKADPDGYTLVLGTNQTHATNESLLNNTPYKSATDFAAIAEVAVVPHVLVVRKDLAVNSVADLVKLAKDKPGTLNYGSTGNGSASHLAMELFKKNAGIDMVHVPFKGAAPLTNEMLGGRIDVAFATLPSVLSQIQAGNLKALGFASAKRSASLPDAPTLAEAGVKGVEADAWFALFAPAKTPAPIIDKLNKALTTALSKDEAKAALAKQGVTLQLTSPAELAAMIPKEVEKWAEVIKISGAKVD